MHLKTKLSINQSKINEKKWVGCEHFDYKCKKLTENFQYLIFSSSIKDGKIVVVAVVVVVKIIANQSNQSVG